MKHCLPSERNNGSQKKRRFKSKQRQKINAVKGTVSRDFGPLFFAENILPGPLMKRLNRFSELLRFRKVIRFQSSKLVNDVFREYLRYLKSKCIQCTLNK